MTNTNTDMELDDEKAPEENEGLELKDTNFNLDGEFKEDPLAPSGTYNGVVLNVYYNKNISAIVWEIVATCNPGMTMLDGSSPIDGVTFQYNNWIPKPGDERIRSKGGRSNKRQVKINMLKTFQDQMQVNMNTAKDIQQAIEEGLWVGISVIFTVSISTYKGRTRNQVDNMQRSEVDFEAPDIMSINEDDIPF